MFVRRRYYFWLVKAYIKKWKKSILLSLLLGIAFFFALFAFLTIYVKPYILDKSTESIGYKGAYEISSLPQEVIENISYGLTRVEEDGSITPAAAQKWEIKDGGKRYVFTLKQGQFFHNNEELTAENIPLNFENIEKRIIDKYTVEYVLENPYSPFLTSVSQPILLDDLSGLGEFQLSDIELNAGFVKTLVLEKKSNRPQTKIINFYPTEEALKTAYSLGEVDVAHHINNTSFKNTNMNDWQNTQTEEKVNYTELVTIFYNNRNDILSNKNVRLALNIALPEDFESGQRADTPIPPTSIYYEPNPNYIVGDFEIAKELLQDASVEEGQSFELVTTQEFEQVAKSVQENWKKIGIDAKLTIVRNPPDTYQILLYKFKVPKDPDQYTLWHSDQINNIVGYKNLRVDKILEDGRIEINIEERKNLYKDFQKFLTDDAPASFLYYPKNFTVKRSKTSLLPW